MFMTRTCREVITAQQGRYRGQELRNQLVLQQICGATASENLCAQSGVSLPTFPRTSFRLDSRIRETLKCFCKIRSRTRPDPHHRYRSSSDHQHQERKGFLLSANGSSSTRCSQDREPSIPDHCVMQKKKASRRSKKAQIEDLEIGTVVEEAGESTDDATQAISQASSQLLPPLDLNLNRQR
ncbi:hypothetical protein MJO28_010377 [Puccinia striiformis f. sp. tritici]|uniref:Uncharacterized protein n=1 Tax=Puccinia striiformis f. sp. tritici TaxID=168172 RepID=A0ACC0E4Y2_9BASI|nr:hypothetical protein MJO28_010377 [Puccinia striiformis f. sp. tritici]